MFKEFFEDFKKISIPRQILFLLIIFGMIAFVLEHFGVLALPGLGALHHHVR